MKRTVPASWKDAISARVRVSRALAQHISVIRILMLLLLVGPTGTVSCTATPQAGFETDAVFEGLGFWVISPFLGRPTRAFHWNGDLLRTYARADAGIVERELEIADCPRLREALDSLQRSILDTAEIAVGVRPLLDSPQVVVDGPVYQLTYYPPHIGGSITLRSYESGDVPWIGIGNAVRRLAAECGNR